ncbi:MAG TPA: hypothetical protein VG035_08690 [Actinomycetota bacterium]|jgi:hypothetical protein|nr:hypothetical protein [Actinomycetota bacterium]
MRRIIIVALSVALLTTTAWVVRGAAAGSTAESTRSAAATISDQSAQRKALYQSELERNLQLRNQAGDKVSAEHGLLAARKALYQSELEHNLAAAPAADVAATQPRPAAPSPDVDVLATLLIGLVGGLVGGAGAMVGWTATTRRRQPRAAAGT